MDTELKGQIERITYHNEENSYTIARVKVQGRADLVTIVGNLLSISPGEVLRIKGSWHNHPRYGVQFKVSSYESVVPATVKGIERYLGSGMIRGIGPVMAGRLVARFGVETLSIIESEPERLREVEGIGEKRIEMISKAWEEQRDIRDVMLFLQGNGVSPAYAVKIYKQFGKDSISVVKENPYRLAMDVFGIGFVTADRIAEQLGVTKDSVVRAEAGILYVLHQLAEAGHVYCPYEELIEECGKVLDVDREVIVKAFGTVALNRRIVVEGLDAEEIIGNNKAVYLPKFHVAETGIAVMLKSLLGAPKTKEQFDSDKAIAWTEKELEITLAERQVLAVKKALEEKVLVITGGPGTGKTTIINSIIRIYEKLGRRVVLAAPTGRAAKRMAEATGKEAKTIHRLLEYSPKEGRFKRDHENPLEADLIVIDETSMVDTLLMYHLLKAVPGAATLILVGDVDQLPSVGAGNVLRDIIDSGTTTTVRLNEIFRQSKESMIIVNAHRVNNGEMPLLTHRREQSQDFYFFEIEDPVEALEKIISLCKDRIPERFGYDRFSDIQVLAPMHRGVIGTSNLNEVLQRELNPTLNHLVRGGRTLKVSDKVMQLRNNYDKDVFNGDIGRVSGVDRELQEVQVDYDGSTVTYGFSELDEITLAYAISVHKSQGSEYPVVIMPVLTQHYLLLQRNLLYTGITRGKELVVLVGTKKALAIAIANNKPQKRYTLLRQRLGVRLSIRNQVTEASHPDLSESPPDQADTMQGPRSVTAKPRSLSD